MNCHVHLRDNDGKTLATINDVGSEIGKIGVILWKGDYYTYHSLEVKNSALHLFFVVANIMEVNVA